MELRQNSPFIGEMAVPFIYETAEDRVGEPPSKQDRLDLFFPVSLEAGQQTT